MPRYSKRVYQGMVCRYFPGRTAGRDYSETTAAHLDATTFIEVQIEEWSAKARRADRRDPWTPRRTLPAPAGWYRFELVQSQ